jgi:hypothetical protein
MPDAKEVLHLRLCPLEASGWDDFGGIRPVTFSHDGRLIATAWPAGTAAKLWDSATGKLLCTLEGGRRWTYCVAFSSDDSILAMTCKDGIRLWDARTGRQVRIIDSHEEVLKPPVLQYRCVFSPDGRTLVTAGSWKEVHFWDWHSGEEVGRISLKEPCVESVCLSTDGETLALTNGVSGSKVEVYELRTQGLVHELHNVGANIACVTASSDGVTLALSDCDHHEVILWNLYTCKQIGCYKGHRSRVYQLAFSPDGKELVSASKDGTLLFWKVPEIRLKAREIVPKRMEYYWEKLTWDSPAMPYEMMWEMMQAGDDMVAFIKERVKPVPAIETQTVQKLVANLDDPAYATRKKAAEELAKVGEPAEPALRKALEGQPSTETRKQIDGLLSKLRFPTYSGEPLRALRSVQVLERIATPKAREVLEGLAKGAPGARLTKDAKAAADRLARRKTKE